MSSDDVCITRPMHALPVADSLLLPQHRAESATHIVWLWVIPLLRYRRKPSSSNKRLVIVLERRQTQSPGARCVAVMTEVVSRLIYTSRRPSVFNINESDRRRSFVTSLLDRNDVERVLTRADGVSYFVFV